LHEVQEKGGDQESYANENEEREAGNKGFMS